LAILVDRLMKVLDEHTTAHEVILVVDGSPDSTWQIAEALDAKYPTVHSIELTRNYGQHNAILAGVRAASLPIVVTMDDDLQHPPEEIPKLLSALRDDVDLVYGIPSEEEHGHFRNLASRSVKAAMTRGLGIENARSISAFRAFRTYLREGCVGLTGPHASVDVALSWSTRRVATQEVRMDPRTEGRSNYSFRLLVKHAVNMLLGYSSAPLRFVGYLGVACGFIGMVLLAFVLWAFVSGSTTVPGFTTLASMIAIFSGAQMLAIAVVGEYVGRVHSGNMGRPTYVVRQRDNTDSPVNATHDA
jgi:undecaprenyl-phosphate 4-deoxy-4-formamido-L-arabinose transferase